MKITYLGHACFCLMYKDWRIVLDPYADDNVPGLPPLRVDAERVYCSHGHGDHNFEEGVNLKRLPGDEPYTLEEFITPHDEAEGAKRGMNTVRIFTFGSLRVAHMGDLGCELTPDQLDQLMDLDVVMIPVGGFYTIGPDEAWDLIEAIQPRVIIPMHYKLGDLGLTNVAELSDFLVQIEEYNEYPGNTITVDKKTEAQVAVLKFIPN